MQAKRWCCYCRRLLWLKNVSTNRWEAPLPDRSRRGGGDVDEMHDGGIHIHVARGRYCWSSKWAQHPIYNPSKAFENPVLELGVGMSLWVSVALLGDGSE